MYNNNNTILCTSTEQKYIYIIGIKYYNTKYNSREN